MFPSRFLAQAAVSFLLVLRANAESHVIQFVNQCGYGSPALMLNGVNILTSNTYTSNGPYSGIAYLQTGYCNTNGENCTLLETTLVNPTCAGCGSSTDLSLISPHHYSVTTSFSYYNGCDGQGKICTSETCVGDAFFVPTDYVAQVQCETDNVNLLVAFCANASQIVLEGGAASATAGSPSPPTSSLPTTTSSLPTNSLLPLTSSLPPPSNSLPSSSLPPPSSIPNSQSSTPGSVPPVTPSMTSTPSTSTPTPKHTGIDIGCGETEPTTPSSTPIPTHTSSEPATSAPMSTPLSAPPSAPLSTPTSTPTSKPAILLNSSSSPSSASASPTTTPRCRPRSTTGSLTPSNSAPTSPAVTPTTTPSTSTPSAQFRRHRRAHRIHY